MYFAATGPDGRELFVIDEDLRVTQVADIVIGPQSSYPELLAANSDQLIFRTWDGGNNGLYSFDGSNVHQFENIRFTDQDGILEFDDRLFVSAFGSDGGGFYAIKDTDVELLDSFAPILGSPSPVVEFRDELFIFASGLYGERFYRSDGRIATEFAVDDTLNLNPFAYFNGGLIAWARTDSGFDLYATEGDNLSRLGSFNARPGSFLEFRNELYFSVGEQLFKSDGGGITFFAAPSIPFGTAKSLIVFDEHLFFSRDNEIFATDGENLLKVFEFDSASGPRDFGLTTFAHAIERDELLISADSRLYKVKSVPEPSGSMLAYLAMVLLLHRHLKHR